jgi:type II secretory pathway pseudopilin PulG
MTRPISTASAAQRGFMLLDAIIGIILLGSLLTVLAVNANLRNRAAVRMASQRAAMQTAEKALADLQRGATTAPADAADRISVRRTGQRIGAMEWVQVTAFHDGRQASLSGLAPATQPGSGGAP